MRTDRNLSICQRRRDYSESPDYWDNPMDRDEDNEDEGEDDE